MGVRTLVSIEEYLSFPPDPDVDYVDGELEDRCVGEKDHAKLQFKMTKLLDSFGWFAIQETRLRASSTRFRVPDVCVYENEPDEQIFTSPPLLIIEVLSPEDRMARMQRKLEDYFQMGCRNIWILDPFRKEAFTFDGTATTEVHDKVSVGGQDIAIHDIFPPR